VILRTSVALVVEPVKSNRYCALMTQPDWSARITAVVASQVKRLRNEREISGQQLADASEKLGFPLKRSVLANLENGRRETVSVAEVLALAYAIGVPPIMLLLPFGAADTIEVLPGQHVPVGEAFDWLTGQQPTGHWHAMRVGWDWVNAAEVVDEFRVHHADVQMWEVSRRSSEGLRQQATTARKSGDSARAEQLDSDADQDARNAELMWMRIRQFRARIRRRKLRPPPLPVALASREEAEGPLTMAETPGGPGSLGTAVYETAPDPLTSAAGPNGHGMDTPSEGGTDQ